MSQDTTLPKFTILWIEDTDDVVTMQEGKIRTFLKANGFDLELIWEKKGNDVENKIQAHTIDLILTDKNIPGPSGTALIKKIREHLPLTDILFYSTTKIPEKVYNEIGRLGMVRFWGDKRVVAPVKELIEKSLERYKDMYFIRGYIIARSIDLELQMDKFLSIYFKIPEDALPNFHTYLLENTYNLVSAKRLIVGRVLVDHKIKAEFPGLGSKLEYIYTMRNRVAHCRANEKNTLILMGKEIVIDRAEISKLIKEINKASEMIASLTEKFSKKNKTTAKRPAKKK